MPPPTGQPGAFHPRGLIRWPGATPDHCPQALSLSWVSCPPCGRCPCTPCPSPWLIQALASALAPPHTLWTLPTLSLCLSGPSWLPESQAWPAVGPLLSKARGHHSRGTQWSWGGADTEHVLSLLGRVRHLAGTLLLCPSLGLCLSYLAWSAGSQVGTCLAQAPASPGPWEMGFHADVAQDSTSVLGCFR